MNRLLTMKRLSILFGLCFAVAVSGAFAYDALVKAPGDRCEADGGWWDAEGRVCATPISIAEITGRPNGVSRAEASDRGNRELIDIETRLRQRDAAIAADADRQREALAAQRGN